MEKQNLSYRGRKIAIKVGITFIKEETSKATAFLCFNITVVENPASQKYDIEK